MNAFILFSTLKLTAVWVYSIYLKCYKCPSLALVWYELEGFPSLCAPNTKLNCTWCKCRNICSIHQLLTGNVQPRLLQISSVLIRKYAAVNRSTAKLRGLKESGKDNEDFQEDKWNTPSREVGVAMCGPWAFVQSFLSSISAGPDATLFIYLNSKAMVYFLTVCFT